MDFKLIKFHPKVSDISFALLQRIFSSTLCEITEGTMTSVFGKVKGSFSFCSEIILIFCPKLWAKWAVWDPDVAPAYENSPPPADAAWWEHDAETHGWTELLDVFRLYLVASLLGRLCLGVYSPRTTDSLLVIFLACVGAQADGDIISDTTLLSRHPAKVGNQARWPRGPL